MQVPPFAGAARPGREDLLTGERLPGEPRGEVGTGTIIDATWIEAPSSTKNKAGKRDPEMHQVRKGYQWHFGIEAHIGVDAETKLVHTVIATAANVADVKGGGAGRARAASQRPHLPPLVQ